LHVLREQFGCGCRRRPSSSPNHRADGRRRNIAGSEPLPTRLYRYERSQYAGRAAASQLGRPRPTDQTQIGASPAIRWTNRHRPGHTASSIVVVRRHALAQASRDEGNEYKEGDLVEIEACRKRPKTKARVAPISG
jgi:hypothetical protein